MSYFILQQDKRTLDALILQESSDTNLQEQFNLYVREDQEPVYLDWIDKPYRLVSDRLKKLLELHDAELQWKSVVLTARQAKRQELYWYVVPPERDVLSEKSQRDPMGKWSHIVLRAGKLRRERLFCAGEQCIVHLDVAESCLRRSFTGMHFIPVDVDTD
ncbi:imm11 family protein [Paenibacillus sp. 481]|uniref:imm11 family protein n=1 Tax=Paenibacillus sp. 481 TaxID=2835869 RepID=UPI001E484761|nr:DUF1629 domain-containing protein [Paenibacillus sp. 481]UHA73170.1 hypothetical protein KIK04_21680 [Paenibacillus sp. 481]